MWHLRNYPTRRKLLKDVENLRAENRHLSIELRNARTDLALEKTASSGYRHENRELKRKLKADEYIKICDALKVPYDLFVKKS